MSDVKKNKSSKYGLRKRKLTEYFPVDDDDDKSIKEEKGDSSFASNFEDSSYNEKMDNTSYSSLEKYVVKNDDISDYEKLRLKNIEDNRKMMLQMGLIDAKREFENYVHKAVADKIKKKETHKKKTRTPVVTPPQIRPRSQRIQNKLTGSPVLSETPLGTPELEAEVYKPRIRNTDAVLSMTVEDHDEEGAWHDFLSNIGAHLGGESETTLTESTESVAKEMRQLCLAALRTKVVSRRIQSLCLHPMESKLLVIAGCVDGSLGLWDVSSDLNPLQFEPHSSPINCISVRSDYNQLLTTSHDGTIRCADLQKSVFNLVYQTDEKKKVTHLTWHCELSEQTLLVAEGSGCVSVIDLRDSDKCKPEMSIQCHPRSVRTVQVHPVKKDYFLTSSGVGECKIFDIRNKKVETSSLLHKKGLTSAFFSPNGTKVLTTSNDDRLRIFDVTTLDDPKEECKVLHDNHTGRWLSVFKAIWHPCSSDIFFIGSMQYPRRVQLYSATGALLKEVKSEDMTTITPVLSLHPKLPIVTGGDSSGRVYVFTTQSYIDKYDLKL